MPQAASIGSSGTGSITTLRPPAGVNRTMLPGRSPIFSRRWAGITTCPLGEDLTTAMIVLLFWELFNNLPNSLTSYSKGRQALTSTALTSPAPSQPGSAAPC